MLDGLMRLSSDGIARLRGWPRLTLAFAAGAAATAAMPPIYAVPVLWVSFPILMWLLEGCRTRGQMAAVGWSFAFGHYLTGFFWIANAFYVDAETFGALAIPAVAGLCAGLALYGAAAVLPLRWIDPDRDAMPDDRSVAIAMRATALAISWTVWEWVRGWLLTGFPWNPAGSVWTAWPAMIQPAAAIGVYGLSFFTVLATAMFAVLGPAPRLRKAGLIAAAPLGALMVLGIAGALRLTLAEPGEVPGVSLRLVQPNIPQQDKWRPGLRERHLEDYIAMSRPSPGEKVTHVIWGEAAVTFALVRDERHRAMAAEVVPKGGYLITGVPRAARHDNNVDGIFNSLIAIDDAGHVVETYDKNHLVPFGEYMPLREFIPLKKLTDGTTDFSAGDERPVFRLSGLPPFVPLICYEVIFSGGVDPTRGGEPRAAWILNVTNDTWFGESTGPFQHLAAAQMRAVEEGLPVVRAATSGVSALIDPYGRVLASLGLNERGVLDGPLPTDAGPTLFARLGNVLFLALLAGFALALWRFAARHERRRRAENEF